MGRSDIVMKAREFIGTPYSDLDCSNFVHKAYAAAGLSYPYRNTATFQTLTHYFRELKAEELPEAGDVVLYAAHMGIYDPDGCDATATNECKRLQEIPKFKDNVRILSARGRPGYEKSIGVEYGPSAFFGTNQKYFRWREDAGSGCVQAAEAGTSSK